MSVNMMWFLLRPTGEFWTKKWNVSLSTGGEAQHSGIRIRWVNDGSEWQAILVLVLLPLKGLSDWLWRCKLWHGAVIVWECWKHWCYVLLRTQEGQRLQHQSCSCSCSVLIINEAAESDTVAILAPALSSAECGTCFQWPAFGLKQIHCLLSWMQIPCSTGYPVKVLLSDGSNIPTGSQCCTLMGQTFTLVPTAALWWV